MNVLEQCTPGEWAIVRELPGVTYIMAKDEQDVFVTPICKISEGSYNKDHKANASLIAAAKEMYAALKLLKAEAENYDVVVQTAVAKEDQQGNNFYQQWEQAIQQANAALQKATGGNP